MFRNVLLPIDLTDKHQAALDVAAQLAQGKGSCVTLLHVIEVIAGLPVEEESRFYRALERSAEKHLQGYVKALSDRHIPCRQKNSVGQPRSNDCRFCE